MLTLSEVAGLDRSFQFLTNSETDHIQGIIRGGGFYELEELELIARYAKAPRRILDVGANIGNHSVYFAARFNPEILVMVEPNPLVTDLLRANLGLNWHGSMNLGYVGMGLSDSDGEGEIELPNESNLGAARVVSSAGGPLIIRKGDTLWPDQEFDLIKIDVEGMEFQVVEGLRQILNRSRGVVFLEVLFRNIDSSIAQMTSMGYRYTTSYQRYGRCINLLFSKSL